MHIHAYIYTCIFEIFHIYNVYHFFIAPVNVIKKVTSLAGSWWGGEAGGVESYCLIHTKYQLHKMKTLLEMDGGDSYTTM